MTPLPARWGRSGFVVAIPARDEADRLRRALRALAADGVRDVAVVANDCSDTTAAVARAGAPGLRMAVIETASLAGGVGEARRIGLAVALDAAGPDAILATTDADCAVRPGWRAALATALTRGALAADVACGRIVPDAAELGTLPGAVQRHGRLEDLLGDLRAALAAAEGPCPHDPAPCHAQEAGAALAFRAGAYRDAGGFAPIRCDEDREIVRRMRVAGLRVAHPWDAVVVASCRTTGRAPGGMADTIAARAASVAGIEAGIPGMRAQIRDLSRQLRLREGGAVEWARLVAEHRAAVRHHLPEPSISAPAAQAIPPDRRAPPHEMFPGQAPLPLTSLQDG